MYKIYLYEQDKMTKLRLFLENIRFRLAIHSSIIETIYVLNDINSAQQFNKIYHTSKFQYLPDPIPQVDLNNVHDLRLELKIPKTHIVYLHFGGLDLRKGTIDILKAIIDSPIETLHDKTFIFAGKQNKRTKELFYPLLENAKKKASIFVYDEFCSYEFLYNLCKTCDIILMPYHVTNLSSGVIGYAALFGKPVIGPSDGLLGNLIRKYQLGKTIDIPINESIFRVSIDSPCRNHLYVKDNLLKNFIKLVMR